MRSSGRKGIPEKEYAQCAPPPLCCVSPQRCANSPLRRVFAPRRLDFGENLCDMGKANAMSKYESETKSSCARNMQPTRLEASDGSTSLGKKRRYPTNEPGDPIWNNAQTSSRPVLGTLCVDLVSETIRPKKQDSYTTCNLVKSEENDNESSSNYKIEKPPSKPVTVCPAACLDHKIFLCPCEMVTAQKLTAAITMTERKEIPGGKGDEADFMIRKSCHIVDGITKLVVESHRRDLCFEGKFSLENLWVTEGGDIKFMGVLPQHISTRGAELDTMKVADIIEYKFFADRKVPPSIQELINLLRKGERRDEDTMSDHISLMPEMERMSLFEWMLKEVQKLKKADPKAYKALLRKLEFRARRCLKNWKGKAEANEHLSKILNYIDPATNLPIPYPETMEGLLQFMRNSIEHLPKHSYDHATQSSLYYLF